MLSATASDMKPAASSTVVMRPASGVRESTSRAIVTTVMSPTG